MLIALPADVLGRTLRELDLHDCVRLRGVCRHLRSAVSERLVFDGVARVNDVSGAFAAFVRKVPGFRPSDLTVRGGICWPALLDVLPLVGASLRRLRVSGASVNGARLKCLVAGLPALEHLRLDHVTGGVMVIPDLPGPLQSLDMRAGAEDPWATDISVFGWTALGGGAANLQTLRLVLNRPLGTAHAAWNALASRGVLRELWLVHWGTFDIRDLATMTSLDTLSLHATGYRGLAEDDLVLPSVRRVCLPWYLWRRALRWFPNARDMVLCAGRLRRRGPYNSDDSDTDDDDDDQHDTVSVNIQFLLDHPLSSLTLCMNRVDALAVLVPDMDTYRQFTDAVTFRVVAASIVDVRIMCDHGDDVEVSVLGDTELTHDDLHEAVLAHPPWHGDAGGITDDYGAIDMSSV
jgi:hypothetical protein